MDRDRTINVDKRLALKLTMTPMTPMTPMTSMTPMMPIFTAHTNIHQIFVDIFFEEFYTSGMENPKEGGINSLSPYTAPTAVQYRISPISVKKSRVAARV
jgi:hypothetical protein